MIFSATRTHATTPTMAGLDNASLLLSLAKSGAPPSLLLAQKEHHENQQQQRLASFTMNPRISKALFELEAAEALLAKTRASAVMKPAALVQPTPWLLQVLLASKQQQRQNEHTTPLTTISTLTDKKISNVPGKQQLSQVLSMVRDMPAVSDDASVTTTSSSAVASSAGTAAIHTNDEEQHAALPPGTHVDQLSDNDVLCGRGGKSNHHPGNKRYRQVISQMKSGYRRIGSKTAKTDLSRAIVDHVVGYGGRFLRFDSASQQYVVLSKSEARKKTSQALREAKQVKWTA